MKRIPAGLRRKAKPIALLLLDVDGVLTDGRIIIDDRGVETLFCGTLITAQGFRSLSHREMSALIMAAPSPICSK